MIKKGILLAVIIAVCVGTGCVSAVKPPDGNYGLPPVDAQARAHDFLVARMREGGIRETEALRFRFGALSRVVISAKANNTVGDSFGWVQIVETSSMDAAGTYGPFLPHYILFQHGWVMGDAYEVIAIKRLGTLYPSTK